MSWQMLRRLLAYVVLSVLALLLLTITIVATLLHSEQGSHWLIDQVQHLVPGELQLERFEGKLSGPLEIHGIAYRDTDLSVEVKRIYLDWRPMALFEWRVHLIDLSLEGTRLNLPESEEELESDLTQTFEGLSLPLELQIESARIEDFQLIMLEDTDPISLQRLVLQAEVVQQRVSLTRLEAEAFSAQAVVTGNLELSPRLPLDLLVEWRYQLPEGPELQGQGAFSGSLDKLRVNQIVATPVSAELDATLFELEKTPRWDIRLQLDKTDIGAFVEGFPAQLSGLLQSSGTVQDVEAVGQLEFFEPSLGSLNGDFQAHYADGVIQVERLLISAENGLKIEGQGRYSPDDELGTLAADLNWNGLRWPLIGNQMQFFSQDGSLSVEGRPDDYRYQLDLDAQLPDLPPALGRLTTSGSGNLQGLVLQEMSLAMQEGRIQGNGRTTWQPELSWYAEIKGEAINPGIFHEEFPGSLAMVLSSKGQMQEQGLQADAVLQTLEGEIKGYPLRAKGEILLDAGQLSFKSLEVFSGANQALLEGTAGDTLNLSWSIQAPELNTLWSELSGDLNAQGLLTGKAATPRLEAAIEAREIVYKENKIGNLQAKTDLNLDGGQQVNLHLQAAGLALGERVWDELLVNVTGLRDKHHVEMQLTGQKVPQLRLGIDAALNEHYIWSGTLQQLALELLEFGNWELESPAGFILGEQAQSMQRACLKSGAAGLCGSFSAQLDEGWRGQVHATQIPFAILQHWLPEETQISGHGNLVAEFSAKDDAGMRGSAEFGIPEASLAFELAGEAQDIDFSGSAVTLIVDEQSARSELNIPLAGLGGIQGNVILPAVRLMQLNLEGQAVNGKFKGRIDDLSLVSVILPGLQQVRGAVTADFTLAGTLADPDLQGEAALQDGAVDIPELGIELRDMSLMLAASDLNRVRLNGSVSSGGGSLKLSGETQLQAKQGFPTELQIKGENWVVANIPEAEVHLSPDIAIQHSNERTEVNGEVHIPFARLRPRQMPATAVSGSPDLVLVGGDSQPVTKTDPRLYSRLRIVFGDRVSFEGMGLRANLTGNLLVVDEPGRPVRGSGRVGVVDGTYRAYGQDLKIERGYALFADSPVDNPGLNVRAVREVNEITAGLRVTGTLKNPKLSLFSTPVMSEREVLSYLLTGRAPGESGGGDVSLAIALQAAGAGSLASEISRQVGLDELRVETGSTLEEASVVAGTYLSPRLYVQYVNELATKETKLRLRYDITERVQIQTESGVTQGVDLFYIIER